MFIDVHTHNQAHRAAVQSIFASDYLKGKYPIKQFFTVGVHPWYADLKMVQQFSDTIINKTHPNLIGIGECGLDRLKGPEIKLQKEVFEIQLNLAKKMDLPVIIHQVKALSDLLIFIKKYESLTFIIHGYYGNEIQTKTLLDLNVYFSFGPVLKQMNLKLKKSLELIPINRLFLETDDEEMDISFYYRMMAELKKCTLDVLESQILINFQNVFKRNFNELD
jgi:TatD DNase family protein